MNHLLLLGGLGTGEVIIIALIVLLLFGGKKIPGLVNGIMQGIKDFKKEIKEEPETKDSKEKTE